MAPRLVPPASLCCTCSKPPRWPRNHESQEPRHLGRPRWLRQASQGPAPYGGQGEASTDNRCGHEPSFLLHSSPSTLAGRMWAFRFWLKNFHGVETFLPFRETKACFLAPQPPTPSDFVRAAWTAAATGAHSRRHSGRGPSPLTAQREGPPQEHPLQPWPPSTGPEQCRRAGAAEPVCGRVLMRGAQWPGSPGKESGKSIHQRLWTPP